MQNDMCDNNRCATKNGEVRVIPTGGGGNMILCFACYRHEMSYRRERIKELGEGSYDLPSWESLEVYKGAM